ncbi:choice-of-anchor C family PEP-CTERM protein [Phenylobacterium sp.]|uniref:choice-of-anchor C family PEP-CTERM protein n=1 Tax=Phenylobacterium sp. TaxID=1871053 RepID=UPI0027337AD3|nr:choice-of-anchor C family protein [Phenylobacterium sp.]MDP3855070.1 choice-of-anchor C family protein [Phenylobacterium sp.]
MYIKTALLAAAALTCASASAHAATILNGSFESGVAPGTFTTLDPLDNTSITGWTVGGAGVDYIGSYWIAADGDRSIDLSALSGGSVSQTISTIAGVTYTVSFALAGNPDGPDEGKIAVTSVSGSLPQIDIFSVTAANTHANMGWQTYTYTFKAFDSTSELTFASATNTPYGPALDNVTISSAIPEPATWAMMIIGFGAVGGVARSARRKQSFAVA